MANFVADKPLAGAFHAIMDKIEANIQLQSCGIENESSYIKNTFWERFKLYMPVLHQSSCSFKTGLSSLGKI